MSEFECDRCGKPFAVDDRHTKIVRRDYAGETQPSTVEYLCGPCLEAYREFVGG